MCVILQTSPIILLRTVLSILLGSPYLTGKEDDYSRCTKDNCKKAKT